jgi:hypothetical protein
VKVCSCVESVDVLIVCSYLFGWRWSSYDAQEGIEISSTLLPSHILFCSIVGYELNKNFDIFIVFELTFWIILLYIPTNLAHPNVIVILIDFK